MCACGVWCSSWRRPGAAGRPGRASRSRWWSPRRPPRRPTRPALPETAVEVPRARDVNLPPELPPLGRPLPDRASLDDPTADPGNAAIIARRVALHLATAAFQKVTLPDPFELAAQVRPRVS